MHIPKQDQITQCLKYLHILIDFAEGVVLMAVDFNCILDPQVDSTTGHSSISRLQITRLKKFLLQYNLVDVWRILSNGPCP